MKQILIITRISIGPEGDEFDSLFNVKKGHLFARSEDTILDIYNGIDLYSGGDYSLIAEKIKQAVNPDAVEVLMLIHFTGYYDDLRFELNKINSGANWQIRQYSSQEPRYETQIKPLFKDVINDSSKIEEIYTLFSADPVLEAKLKLLQQIANGETYRHENSKPFELDEVIREHQECFDKYMADQKDYFSIVSDKDALADYIARYNKFYDCLGLSH